MDKQIEQFKKNGYLILEDVFTTSFLDQLRQAFVDQHSINLNRNSLVEDNKEIKRKLFPIKISGAFNDEQFYFNSKVIPYIEKLLSPLFVIESVLAPTTAPGSPLQHIHSDGGILFNKKTNMFLPAHAIGVMIPLIGMNTTTGTTRVWPGSHQSPKSAKEFESDLNFIDPDLKKGSCMLLDTRTIHAGTPNQSDAIRPMVYITYAMPWYINFIDFKSHANLIMDDQEFDKVSSSLRAKFIRRNITMTF